MHTARTTRTVQLWDVVDFTKLTGTLPQDTLVNVIRRHPRVDHVVIFHEGITHAVHKHHLELVQA